MIPLNRIKKGNITKQIEMQHTMAKRHGVESKESWLKNMWDSITGWVTGWFIGRSERVQPIYHEPGKTILLPHQRRARMHKAFAEKTKQSQRLMK